MRKKEKIRIGIIGIGPRGTQLLESLTYQLSLMENPPHTAVSIITEKEPGVGIYDVTEPDYLLLNVICDGMTIHPDYTLEQHRSIQSVLERETFYEWLIKEDLKFHGHDINFNDYLPRNLMGRYLNYSCEAIIKKLSEITEVNVYHKHAENIKFNDDDSITILLEDGAKVKTEVVVDKLYLTTGHPHIKPRPREAGFIRACTRLKKKNAKAQFIHNPYPISKLPEQISHDMSVGIEGTGLSGFDVLASLTIGKGGRFHEQEDKEELIYEPSNQEPKIVFYSLDGVPLEGQATIHRTHERTYEPSFFTYEKINLLRKKFGVGESKKLDFDVHLLPEIKKEMQFVYYKVLITNKEGPLAAEDFAKKFIQKSKNRIALSKLIHSHIEKEQRFNWNKIIDPMHGMNFESPSDFKKWMIDYLKNDIRECSLGYDYSPYKAACNAVREIRSVLCYSVNFAGLTGKSHQKFLKKYGPIINRISVGPPKNRIRELLALFEAGMLDIFVGKNPKLQFDERKAKFIITGEHIKNNPKREVDVIIKAQIHPIVPHLDESNLMKNALSSGLFCEFENEGFHPGGINVNKRHNPISKDGKVQKNIWVLGMPVAGVKYYSDVPMIIGGVNPQVWIDANQIVSDSLKMDNKT
jgi:uncharacterized NAD(P)/FAD-binding protein YdhS